MKTITQKFPTTTKFVLAILLFGLALVVSTIFNKGTLKQYFPYLSCIILFLVTWLLLKRDKKPLNELGLNLNLRNISFLPLGIIIGSFTFLGAKLLRALYTGETIELNNPIDFTAILSAFYFILPQVATEEFLFRGYLFKKTIDVSNVIVANIIFSVLFMLIHVVDENVLQNKGLLILLAITIPVGHLLFATALLKSKTLFFPIGIHLGNNWATRHLISGSNSNDSILYMFNIHFDTWTPFIVTLLIANGFFLLVTFVIWKWYKIIFFTNTK